MNKPNYRICDGCGCIGQESQPCAGAIAYEGHMCMDTRGLPDCNCCDSCRAQCREEAVEEANED